MERTTIEGDKIYLGRVELSNLIKNMVRTYKFHNNNKEPETVVIPIIEEVDGITVIYQIKEEE